MTDKELNIITDRVIEKIKCNNAKDYYREAEAMLRSYNFYKLTIDKNNNRIDDILKMGITETRKNGSGFDRVQGGKREYKGLPEIELEKIEHLKSENLKLEKRIIRVENALMCIERDPYYDVITLRYFDNMTIEDIAEELEIDKSTVVRNRTRLINELKYQLFSEIILD